MPLATLTTKGQVTIPKDVRAHLRLETGDRLSFDIRDDGTVELRPVVRHVRELAGILHRPGRPPMSTSAIDAGIARRMRRATTRT